MNDQISELLTTIVQIVAVFCVVAVFNIYIALILALYAVIYISVRNRADRNIAIYRQKEIIQEDRYSNLLGQMVSGLQEIKAFNMLAKLEGKLNQIQRYYSKFFLKRRRYHTIRDNDIRFITHFFRIALYVLLAFLMMNGEIGIDILILVIAYHESIMEYLDDLILASGSIREVSIAVDRVSEVLNYRSSEKIDYGDNDTDDIFGAITFRDVQFKYKDKEILRGLNFKIKRNSIVAITGESGSGKTTIINLLLRLYKLKEGTILIDNTNIYDFTKKIYSSNVAVVNQKPFIFNMSIRHNLDFVDTDIANQIEACKKAGIHDFIATLPNGYNTVLRENANNISGGQKQLISIARTLLSKSEILLLDDITTSLDPDTAKRIPALLRTLKEDHTIVMVTKKPDLMKAADRVIVLSEGKIAGDGRHEDLISSNETYQALYANKSPSGAGGI
jgi:ABC-type bacteriocin/lantibiotic exporter with double-glycine peptidase domain